MNDWMNETKVEIETFVLKGTGVMFPEFFAQQHDEHLVSISANPGEAARWWHWQNDKCFPGEGWASFMLNGVQIMPMDAWTNVDIFWQELLNTLERYVSTGRGQGEFSEETATFSLVKRGTVAVFELLPQHQRIRRRNTSQPETTDKANIYTSKHWHLRKPASHHLRHIQWSEVFSLCVRRLLPAMKRSPVPVAAPP